MARVQPDAASQAGDAALEQSVALLTSQAAEIQQLSDRNAALVRVCVLLCSECMQVGLYGVCMLWWQEAELALLQSGAASARKGESVSAQSLALLSSQAAEIEMLLERNAVLVSASVWADCFVCVGVLSSKSEL